MIHSPQKYALSCAVTTPSLETKNEVLVFRASTQLNSSATQPLQIVVKYHIVNQELLVYP